VREEEGRNVRVVLEEVALGEAELGPEEFFQVGEADGAAVEVQLYVLGVDRKLYPSCCSALTPSLSRGERGRAVSS